MPNEDGTSRTGEQQEMLHICGTQENEGLNSGTVRLETSWDEGWQRAGSVCRYISTSSATAIIPGACPRRCDLLRQMRRALLNERELGDDAVEMFLLALREWHNRGYTHEELTAYLVEMRRQMRQSP